MGSQSSATCDEDPCSIWAEAAQVTLRHSQADVTQIYAERDMVKAEAVMREVG